MRRRAGFSLTELTVVMAIILIVSGLSLPSLGRVIDNVRLKTAAQQAASLYQQARIRATQDDTYYNVVLGTRNADLLCLDIDGDGACSPTDPKARIGNGIIFSNAGIPVPLDATILGFTPVAAENSNTFTPQGAQIAALAWNSRGLPCQKVSATSPCTNWLAAGAGGPVGWIQYVQMQKPSGTLYAAVVVSPSGRIKVWNYSPNDPSGVSWR